MRPDLKNVGLLSSGSVFSSTPGRSEEQFFVSFWGGKDSISLYLFNLIFDFFAPLHFMCILFLQSARYHFKISLL